MAEDREALLRHYQTMREEFLAAIEGFSDEQMSDPSLDDWAIKDHLAHIAMWDDLRAEEVTRISAGNATAWRMTGGQDEIFNDLAYEFRRALSPAQARWELANSREKLLAAIAAASPRALDPSLYGEAGLVSSHEAEHAGWIRRWRVERGI
jgi:uncharacterized damage-inducible protein DinB